jgi:hypothetical protein
MVVCAHFCERCRKPEAAAACSRNFNPPYAQQVLETVQWRPVANEPKTYVPLNAAITMKREDGTGGIDTDALMRDGMRLAEEPGVEWQVESSAIEPRSAQQRRPEGRKSFGCPHCCGWTDATARPAPPLA